MPGGNARHALGFARPSGSRHESNDFSSGPLVGRAAGCLHDAIMALIAHAVIP
jgi:hypothetical protein